MMRASTVSAVLFVCLRIAHAQTVTVDQSNANTGTLQNGLHFGGPKVVKSRTFPTGEGIASKRDAGGNQYGLDFFTGGKSRVSITADGRIGIGIPVPSKPLEIHDFGDVEFGLQSKDAGGRLWTIQSSGISKGPLDASFQIIDRTAGLPRLLIDTSGTVSVNVLKINGGADLAEPFPASDAEIAPGSVVIIDEDRAGQLKVSTTVYDRRVAGVVSGAGGVHSALTLNQLRSASSGGNPDVNVALGGRVYVLADASADPIRPGDLLTTSATPGHCMKASDFERAKGAILGKAMTSLSGGKGLVLALVTLQ